MSALVCTAKDPKDCLICAWQLREGGTVNAFLAGFELGATDALAGPVLILCEDHYDLWRMRRGRGMTAIVLTCGECRRLVSLGRRPEEKPAEPACTCAAEYYDCDREDGLAWPMRPGVAHWRAERGPTLPAVAPAPGSIPDDELELLEKQTDEDSEDWDGT